MPANVETMAAVVNEELDHQGRKIRTVPWHGLGKQVPATMTDAEALELGGVNWTVGATEVFYRHPVTGLIVPASDHQAIVRESDGRLFQIAGRLYNPFQNDEVVEFGSTLVDHFGAKWDTIGSLKDGAIVFASLRLADVLGTVTPLGLEAEALDLYLLVTNAHDGERAFKAAITPIRVVCTNTEAFALRKAKLSWTLRHTGNLRDRVAEAQASLGLVSKYVETYEDTVEQMLAVEHEIEQVEALIADLIPVPERRGRDQALDKRQSLLDHVRSTPTVPRDYRLTSWGLLQGIGEWAEHEADFRSRKSTPERERQMLKVLFGGPAAKLRDAAFAKLAPAR